MTEAGLLEQVRALRDEGRSPKEIARALHVAPAKVAPLVRELATRRPGALPELVGCWVNAGWSSGLGVQGHEDWPGAHDDHPDRSGLACVLVARKHRYDKVSCCTYLVDTWCLGVKDALGPRSMNQVQLRPFIDLCFTPFDEDPLPAPIELAQHLVWGAVGYARGLGFEPHPDFTTAAGHLDPPDSSCPITFGRGGCPDYIEGPYDNARRVMSTLERSVGAGNFHFTSPSMQ